MGTRAGSATDIDFMSELRAAMSRRPSVMANLLLVAIVAFVALATLWAAVAEVDRVSTGEGRAMPSRRVQVVQNLEGGIVSELNVAEGDVVAAGQVLMRDLAIHPRFIESIRVRFGQHTCAAQLAALGTDRPAALLSLDGELEGTTPLSFDATAKGPYLSASQAMVVVATPTSICCQAAGGPPGSDCCQTKKQAATENETPRLSRASLYGPAATSRTSPSYESPRRSHRLCWPCRTAEA